MIKKILLTLHIFNSCLFGASLDLVPREVIQRTVQFMPYETLWNFEKTNKRNRYTSWESLAKGNRTRFQDWIDYKFLDVPVWSNEILVPDIVSSLLYPENKYVSLGEDAAVGILRMRKLPNPYTPITQSQQLYGLLKIPHHHPLLELMASDGVAKGEMGYIQSKKDLIRLAHGGIRRAQELVIWGLMRGVYGFERVDDLQEILNYSALGWPIPEMELPPMLNFQTWD